MRRGFGYIKAPLVSSNWDNPEVLKASTTLFSCDNRASCGKIKDQGSTSSCVAHSIRNALVYMLPDYDPCINSIYALAKIHSGFSFSADNGASLQAALSAVGAHGFCLDSVWPWAASEATKPPPWDVARAGYDKIGLRYHVVEEERVESLKTAVSRGFTPLIATIVDATYQELTNWDIWPGCDDGDGHALMVCGFDEKSIYVQGSWGLSHGEAGFSRIAWEHIEDEEKTHVCAVMDVI